MNITNYNLSKKDFQFYEENGYLLLEDIITVDFCNKLIVEAEKVANGSYRFYLTMHQQSKVFLEAIRHPNILKILDDLNQDRLIPIGSVYFFCKPGNPMEKGSVWHQDNYAAKASIGSYSVAAIILDDADESNGALQVFPGTHKLGDLPSIPKENFIKNNAGEIIDTAPAGNPTEIPKGFKPLQLKYKKGSLLILHGHILHGAEANKNKQLWRRIWYMHYIKDGHPFWPGWNAKRNLIERDKKYDK